MALNGTRIAVLKMDNSGQDRDYPPGQDPMIAMVTAALLLERACRVRSDRDPR